MPVEVVRTFMRRARAGLMPLKEAELLAMENLGAPLITADRRLAKAASTVAVIDVSQ